MRERVNWGSESESNHIPLGGMVVVGHMDGECSNTWPCSFLLSCRASHADADDDTLIPLLLLVMFT